jgi:hypothetical protein
MPAIAQREQELTGMGFVAWFAQFCTIKYDGSIGGNNQSIGCFWQGERASGLLFSEPAGQLFDRACITLLDGLFIDG